MRYLLDRISEKGRFSRWFGLIPIFDPKKPGRITYVIHPYLHVGDNPNITLLGALKFLSQLQKAVHKTGMKPPGRIIVSYPYHRIKEGNYEMLIVLPHPYYWKKVPKEEKSKVVRLPIRNVNLRLRYWDSKEIRLIPLLLETYRSGNPEDLANSVLESVGAYYVKRFLKGGEEFLSLRSLRMVGKEDDQTELDLLLIEQNNNGPKAEIYEIKASDGLEDPRKIFEKKLRTQTGVVDFLRRKGFSTAYHFVVVGSREEGIQKAVNEAKKVLMKMPADEKGVHGVQYRGRRIKPRYVEIL